MVVFLIMKNYFIYIMSNEHHTVFYAGVTNNLKRRIYQHKEKLIKGFTKSYNINKLLYYEIFDNAVAAIAREKQIKGGSRQDKIDLIKKTNPAFDDLYPTLFK